MTGEAIAKRIGSASPQGADYESDLLRRARELSADAWAEIYEQNYPPLYRYVHARTGERETAEDLTATVFLEAVKSIRSYTLQGRPLLAWLYAIARNVVNYHYRSLYRKGAWQPAPDAPAQGLQRLVRLRRGEAELGAPSQRGDAVGDPASLVEAWDLRRAVARLSPDQREVMILRYFSGLTTPEVARLLGKQERAVYSLQARAVKTLRRVLG